MALGALLAWVWIPKLDDGPDPNHEAKTLRWPRLRSKGLETLARGIAYANGTDTTIDRRTGMKNGENQRLGFCKIPDLIDFLWSKFFNHGYSSRNNGGTQGSELEEVIADTANTDSLYGVARPEPVSQSPADHPGSSRSSRPILREINIDE
jgi:hypothetical protein